uniref:acetyl-CoA carboxylase beta subunit n=1 Tax=Scabiosa comosa TaxID=1161150 RepID=UPI0021AD4E80|nr:acetyl-CoA carboxylase beta subunit [Scabiosa comosa]UUL71337.1 acetyl-CoA carboxylase beta subunit [Scabiosa comosa]
MREFKDYSLFDFTDTDFDFTFDFTEDDSTAFDEEYFSAFDEESFPEEYEYDDFVEEDSSEEDSTDEDITEEDSSEEYEYDDFVEEDSSEEDSTDEDITEEDSSEEYEYDDFVEEDSSEEDSTDEDITEEDSSEEYEYDDFVEEDSSEEDLIRDEFYHPLLTTEDGLDDPRFYEDPFDEESFPFDEESFPEDNSTEIKSTTKDDSTEVKSTTKVDSTEVKSTTKDDSTEIKSTTEVDSTEVESTTEEDFTEVKSTTEVDSTEIKSTTEVDSTEVESTTEEDFTEIESTTEEDSAPSYKHLWVLCEDCYTLNYKRFLKERLYICEGCESHLKMNSSERLELLVDLNTWDPINEKIASTDPIQWDSEEPLIGLDSESEGGPVVLYLGEIPIATVPEEVPFELDIKDDPYIDRIDSYKKKTGLTEAIQTGIAQLNGIPIAMGVMEFGFMGGSMGSAVGEKITRLIEYATTQCLPLIIVCASGGARMQEGSLSLMQMAKISAALYHFQIIQKFLYLAILTSPTTGGVTASFGMLGDMIVAEPNAYIAFAGKRVIEQTLNKEVPEGSQETEYLFDKGLFDQVVPRKTLKRVLNEVFDFHSFFPLNQNSIESNRTFSFII